MQQVLVGAVLVWDFGVRGEGSLPQRLLEVCDGVATMGVFASGGSRAAMAVTSIPGRATTVWTACWPAQPQPMMPSLIGVDMGVFLLGFKPSLVVSEGFGLEIVPFGNKDQAEGGGEAVAGCGGVAEEMEVLGVVVGVVA